MPDSSSSGPPGKKELSVEMRLLLAFVLMGVVLFTTPYFFKAPPGPAPLKRSEQPPPAKSAQAPPPPSIAPAAPAPGQVVAANEETVTVDTDLYHIVFSNRGALVRSWILKKYKDSHGKPL